MDEAKALGTIRRVIRLLQVVAEAEGDLSVRELTERMELPASTTHRLLQILASDAIIQKNGKSKRYSAGPELLRIASLLTGKRSLVHLGRQHVETVVERCNEACSLIVFVPTTYEVYTVVGANSSNPLRYEIKINERHSVLWGATGRSVLAFLTPEEQRAAYEQDIPSPASGERLPPWEQFLAELEAIRERGYATSRSQTIRGAFGMGSPVFDGTERPIGALCVTLPEIRYTPSIEVPLGALLIEEAGRLSRTLGYSKRGNPA